MINLEEYLYGRIVPILKTWDEEGIYAISFFVYSNELNTCYGFKNLSRFYISYNTETDCKWPPEERGDPDYSALIALFQASDLPDLLKDASVKSLKARSNGQIPASPPPPRSEVRWNYAHWRQNEEYIIDPQEGDEGMETLLAWYAQEGIRDVGMERPGPMYDEAGQYIGKEPVGYYELLTVVSNVARRIQSEGLLLESFGRPIPIIVHELEYPWYVEEATRNANPNGEAHEFLAALAQNFQN